MNFRHRHWAVGKIGGPQYASFPPTEGGLTIAIEELVPHVRSAKLESPRPGFATATVRMRWYAWLTLGLLHWAARRRVRRVLVRFAPAGVQIKVRMR